MQWYPAASPSLTLPVKRQRAQLSTLVLAETLLNANDFELILPPGFVDLGVPQPKKAAFSASAPSPPAPLLSCVPSRFSFPTNLGICPALRCCPCGAVCGTWLPGQAAPLTHPAAPVPRASCFHCLSKRTSSLGIWHAAAHHQVGHRTHVVPTDMVPTSSASTHEQSTGTPGAHITHCAFQHATSEPPACCSLRCAAACADAPCCVQRQARRRRHRRSKRGTARPMGGASSPSS